MSWNWLVSWWPWRNPPRALPWHVEMITRSGCHLCEEAWGQLIQAQCRYGFRLTQVDVDGHPDLVARYGDCVPVVLVNGRVRFRGRLNPMLLERLVRSQGDPTR
jgi:hypothetical protein